MQQISFTGLALPGPTGGTYSSPPDPLAGFKGPTSKGKGGERRGCRGGKWREGKERETRKLRGRELGGKRSALSEILNTPLLRWWLGA